MRILRLWQSEVKSNLPKYGLAVALFGLAFLGELGTLQAQNLCQNPLFPGDFSLSKDKVCVGSPVNVVTGPNLGTVRYDYNYTGKSYQEIDPTLVPATSFTYSKPGSYTILQSGQGGGQGGGTFLCKVITVLPLDPIKFTAKACSGRRATITPDLSSLGQYDLYEIYWGDGVRVQKTRAEMATDLSHTYTNAGTYTITIQGIYNPPVDCRSTLAKSDPITVTSAAAQPVITSLKTVSDNQIDIQYQTGSGIVVQLYQKINGAYTPTGQNGSGAGTFSVNSIDAKQTQCFEVVTQDVCTGTGLQSDEVCSLVLDAKAANKQNNLSWQPYAGTSTAFKYYRIYRGTGAPIGQVANSTTSTYSDANNIMCGVQYCYSLEATAGPTTITSAVVCVTGINGDVPGAIGNTVVSIENNHPRLVATLPTGAVPSAYTLVVSRASGPNGTFEPIGTAVNKNTFTDETADPSASSYCYEVAYQSGCGLTSAPTPPVCTVFLSSQSDTGIDWTVDSPFSQEKLNNYTIEVIDSVNNTRQEIPNIINTHYDLSALNVDVQSQKYRIITVSEFGTISYSNFFVFRREAKILVPDAFTPGNDNMNETFVVKGVYFDQFRMTIYDRWGEVIYSTTDKNGGWDGKINGQLAQAGQYMYRVEVVDTTGLKTVRTGAVLLIR